MIKTLTANIDGTKVTTRPFDMKAFRLISKEMKELKIGNAYELGLYSIEAFGIGVQSMFADAGIENDKLEALDPTEYLAMAKNVRDWYLEAMNIFTAIPSAKGNKGNALLPTTH